MTMTTETNGKLSAIHSQGGLRVPVKEIILGDNSRGEIKPGKVAAMAGSIAELAKSSGDPEDVCSGLLLPLSVVKTADGKYELQDGYTRLAALKELGAKTIPVYIVPAKSDDEMRKIRGVAANVVRTDMNMFRLAKTLHEMCVPQVGPDGTETVPEYTREEAAALFGFKKEHVNNLIRCQTKLAPEILSYWEQDSKKGGLLPFRMLTAWAAFNEHADQLKAFKEWVGGEKRSKAERGEEEREGKGKGRKKHAGRSKKEIAAACEEARAGSGIRIALEWVLGQRRKLE